MKEIKYILFLLVAFVAFSCEKNETPLYTEPASLYFADFTEDADSLVFSFTMSDNIADTINLEVNLLGNALSEMVNVPFRIVADETTALPDIHYKSISEVSIDPKTGKCYIPVIVTYDQSMDHAIYSLVIELYKNEYYDIAFKGRDKVRLFITNQLVKPVYWDDLLFLYFGTYSKVKHQKAIDVMEHDFPLKKDDIGIKGYNYYMTKGRELCYYYALNTVYDENGNLIEVWDPF